MASLFIAGITIYLQRALKANLKKSQDYAASKIPAGMVKEYEPYYLKNHSDIKSESGSRLEFTGDGVLYVSPYSKSENDFVNRTAPENEDD